MSLYNKYQNYPEILGPWSIKQGIKPQSTRVSWSMRVPNIAASMVFLSSDRCTWLFGILNLYHSQGHGKGTTQCSRWDDNLQFNEELSVLSGLFDASLTKSLFLFAAKRDGRHVVSNLQQRWGSHGAGKLHRSANWWFVMSWQGLRL